MNLIGRLLWKSWTLIYLFILILGFNACSEEVNVSGRIERTNTPFKTLPPSTTSYIKPETVTPVITDMPLSTRKVVLEATTELALESLPTVNPTLLPCLTKGGIIQTGSLPTDFLKEPLDFRVYLPPCYNQQQDHPYPVLYLFHGQGFSDNQWDRIGVDEEADALIAAGEISPLIIVMPHELGSEPPTGSKFAQAFVEDLVPYIDETYRTLPDRSYRAVGGLSRGGGWAVHFGISKWELFGALGAHSPGIFRADDLYIRKWLDAIPTDSYPRIYIDIGDRDLPEIFDSATWFEQLLNERDIPHEWYFFTGYHIEEYWRAHLDSYLRWYTENW